MSTQSQRVMNSQVENRAPNVDILDRYILKRIFQNQLILFQGNPFHDQNIQIFMSIFIGVCD